VTEPAGIEREEKPPTTLALELALLKDGVPYTPIYRHCVQTAVSTYLMLHPGHNALPYTRFGLHVDPSKVDCRPWWLFYVTLQIDDLYVAQRRPLMVLEYATDLPSDVAVFWPSCSTNLPKQAGPRGGLSEPDWRQGVWSLSARSTQEPQA